MSTDVRPTARTEPVAIARAAAEELLPGAADADDPARGVRRDTLRSLADRGLFSVAVPVADGGLGGDDRALAAAEEHLAGTDGATWFVLTQHRFTQKLTLDVTADGTGGPAAFRHRDALARGDALAGIAIAHLRRPDQPVVRAVPDGDGGWRFTGRSDWCTGWGLVDLVLVAGLTEASDGAEGADGADRADRADRADGRIVFALVPATDRPGLTASAPLALSVMGGTHTVALDLDDMAVAPDEVAAVVDAAAWHARDGATVVDTKPATLGLLRRVLYETDRTGRERDRPAAVEAARALDAEAAPLRERAVALRGDAEHVDERVALRGRIAELAVRAAAGLVAARGGSAMLSGSHEQRWMREATFHLVQAQTDPVRTAQLTALAHPAPWGV